MSNFVDDNTSLPYPKSDSKPLMAGADPTQWVVANDWNQVCQAAVDLRANVQSPAKTVLPDTAVSPGSYTYAAFTVDSKGRLTAASSGLTPALASVTLSAGTGLTGGGTLAANRTFTLADTAVAPASYTYASFTVDQQGRLTAASSGATPALASTTISPGTGMTGGGSLAANRTLTLADTAVTPATYTNSTVTVDQQGRITSASNGVTSVSVLAGDGSDGPVTLSGTTTLTRDMYWTIGTGVSGGIVEMQGYLAHFQVLNGPASGTLTFRSNGGTGGTGLAGTSAGGLPAGGSGAQGTLQVTAATGAVCGAAANGQGGPGVGMWPTSFRAGTGGAGGAGTAGHTGGAAGLPAASLSADNIGSMNHFVTATTARLRWSLGTVIDPGGGGGSGGGGAAQSGGGGGGGGGYVVLIAGSMTNAANISVQAKGGAGGVGGTGGGGGGGGGGGYVVVALLFGNTFPATDVSGGAGGANGGSGAVDGSAGTAGKVIKLGG